MKSSSDLKELIRLMLKEDMDSFKGIPDFEIRTALDEYGEKVKKLMNSYIWSNKNIDNEEFAKIEASLEEALTLIKEKLYEETKNILNLYIKA